MLYKPHQYQDYATNKILDQEAVGLFLDMGLGKSVITLTAIDQLMYNYFDVEKVLVIAPLRVAQKTWTDEIKKWDHLKHLRISKVLGNEKQRIAALQVKADIWIINRENVEWLADLYGKDWPFDMVVIDELSSFKSSKAKRFRALRKVRPCIKRIVGLTGTPAPNGLIDLWPQVYLLDQGERLGKTVTGYRSRYFEPGKRNRTVIFSWDPKPGAEEAIYNKLEDLCVSMSAEDWLQMPERIGREVKVQIPEAARAKYDQLEKDLLLPFAGGDITADTMAILSNKLLQMANGAVYDENGSTREIHQAKLEALDDILEAANGQPVLVFYNYQHDRDRLLKHMPTARVLNTEDDIEKWNQGKIPVMLAHPASAGHGLNLQAGGNIIVWFGLTWSLELYQQANARLYRQGQDKSVIIHHLVAEGTIDEDVMSALVGKDVSQKALLEAVKARIEKYQTT
ncbi:MAG: DEAD/DEAH box helicase [Syntrophomonas sp.]